MHERYVIQETLSTVEGIGNDMTEPEVLGESGGTACITHLVCA